MIGNVNREEKVDGLDIQKWRRLVRGEFRSHLVVRPPVKRRTALITTVGRTFGGAITSDVCQAL